MVKSDDEWLTMMPQLVNGGNDGELMVAVD